MSVKCPISQLPIENDPKLSILHVYHSVITTAQLSLTILSQVQMSYSIVVQPTMSKVSMVPVFTGRLVNATGFPPFIEPISRELILEDVLVTCTA